EVGRRGQGAVVEGMVFCPFSGQKSANGDTRNRCNATGDRRDRGSGESQKRGDDDGDHDADRNSGPLDGWRRSSLRDATSVVLTRMLIADRRWRKRKPIREAYADRRVRERCRFSKRKSDDLRRRSKASLVLLLRGLLRAPSGRAPCPERCRGARDSRRNPSSSPHFARSVEVRTAAIPRSFATS